jgi:hypothetical protein
LTKIAHLPNNFHIELSQVNVADHHFQGVDEGWEKYHWKPWREYFQKKAFSG